MLPHAPSVQMADIPADGITLADDKDNADPDKRNPHQLKDKQIEADNDFEDATKSGNKNVSLKLTCYNWVWTLRNTVDFCSYHSSLILARCRF